jgi:hypothetical protein
MRGSRYLKAGKEPVLSDAESVFEGRGKRLGRIVKVVSGPPGWTLTFFALMIIDD